MKEDNTTPEVEISDIKLSQRKTFRIDGDNSKMLSLDISDLNIVSRLNEAYPKIKSAAVDAIEKMAQKDEVEDDEELIAKYANTLKQIDDTMRELMDYVFDAPVSEVCVPKGTMYDPYNGQFRFEHIIEVLTQLYANNVSDEFNKMKARVNKRTEKYTKRRK